MPAKWIQFGAPLVTLLLLAGMTTADKLRIDPHAADGFHTRAAVAIAQAPKSIGSWYTVKDTPLPQDAEGMLKPNGYVDRQYHDTKSGRNVEMLLVQCRDTRDMQGHYPPVCYPSHGCRMPLPGDAQTWQAGGLDIPGREYAITWPNGYQQTIRNFFVLPGGRLVRDMESVNATAKDYQELVYGVTQIQLLFDASVGGAERDAIFSTLIGGQRPLIDALRLGEMHRAK